MNKQITTLSIGLDDGPGIVNFTKEIRLTFNVTRIEVTGFSLFGGTPSSFIITTNMIPNGDLLLTGSPSVSIHQFINPITINGLYNFSLLDTDRTRPVVLPGEEVISALQITFYE